MIVIPLERHLVRGSAGRRSRCSRNRRRMRRLSLLLVVLESSRHQPHQLSDFGIQPVSEARETKNINSSSNQTAV